MTLLQVWLKQAFGKRFKNQGNMLPHGVQNDGYSCPMFTSNTLAHGVLGQPLLSAEKAVEERLLWFIRLASTQNMAVSKAAEVTMNHDKPQHRKGLTITDLLNPIPEQPREYDSDSDISEYSEGQDNADTEGILPDSSSEYPASSLWESKSDFNMHENEADEDCNVPTSTSDASETIRTWNHIFHKRARSESSESDSGSSYYSNVNEAEPSARKYVKAGDGGSKSAVASRGLRQQVKSGKFKVDDEKYQRWKKKILEGDADATFDESNIQKVRHSICGTVVRVKEPYDSVRWREHLEKCESKSKGKKAYKTPSLFNMGFTIKTSAKKMDTADSGEKLQVHEVPCPGITEADNPKVVRYLKRTGTLGGGARSLPVISKDLFKKLFSKLQKAGNKKKVVDAQMHEWKWRNDHENSRVYSTSCQKKVLDRSADNKRPKPCSDCDAVLRSKPFRNAIRRPIPTDDKFIFINHRFRNTVLARIYGRTVGVKEILETEVCQ